MSHSTPQLHMLSLVVADMAASLDLCRRLWIPVSGGEDVAGAHVQLRMPGGFSLEPGTAGPARLRYAGWRAGPARVRVVTGFSVPAREAAGEHDAGLMSPAGGSRRTWPPGSPRLPGNGRCVRSRREVQSCEEVC